MVVGGFVGGSVGSMSSLKINRYFYFSLKTASAATTLSSI